VAGEDYDADRGQTFEFLSNKRRLPYNTSLPDLNRPQGRQADYDSDLEVMSFYSSSREDEPRSRVHRRRLILVH